MKLLLFVTVMLFACSYPNDQEGSQYDIDKTIINEIYLSNFKPLGFNIEDLKTLQKISKDYPEKLQTIPNDVALRLTSQDTSRAIFYCRWVDSVHGEFRKITDDYSNVFFVSFSSEGEPIDYLAFKHAKRVLEGGKKVYDEFYVDYFFLDECFVINILDTTEKIYHPSSAKIIQTDYWYLDEFGKFSNVSK